MEHESLPDQRPRKKTVLLMCSLISVVYGWPFLAIVERYETGVSMPASEERNPAFALA